MVSGDTGPLHIAGAVGTPIVALFGPTFAERNGPWSRADIAISRVAAMLLSLRAPVPAAAAVHRRHRRRRSGAPPRSIESPLVAERRLTQRRCIALSLARRRVPLGFVTAVAALVLAQPTWTRGASAARGGRSVRCIRIWAAGHLEKGREVTRSGPVSLDRHPLYVGSSVMALGVVDRRATASSLALLAAIYMVATITAAVRTEEAFLRGRVRRRLRRVSPLGRRADGPPVQPRARDAQPRVSRGCRPADWVCASLP